MKRVKKIANYTIIGGMGAIIMASLSGCGSDNNEQNYEQSAGQNQAQNAFVILQEQADGSYKIEDEFPAKETRFVVKKLDGTEEVLTQEQIDALIKEEEVKIDNGTSPLTNPQAQQAQMSGGGMTMGQAMLASMGGAMVGAWLGNKLFGNQNFQNSRQAAYKSPSTYSRSASSFSSNRATQVSSTRASSTGKSGFFTSSTPASSSATSSASRSSSSSIGG